MTLSAIEAQLLRQKLAMHGRLWIAAGHGSFGVKLPIGHGGGVSIVVFESLATLAAWRDHP
jgi:hypothetical protein